MDYKTFVQVSDDLVGEMRETDDAAKKQSLKQAWFNAAADLFNTEIAGDVTLADGRTLTIPSI